MYTVEYANNELQNKGKWRHHATREDRHHLIYLEKQCSKCNNDHEQTDFREFTVEEVELFFASTRVCAVVHRKGEQMNRKVKGSTSYIDATSDLEIILGK